MDVAVSLALDIYDAKKALYEARQYFLSLDINADNFMDALAVCKKREIYLNSLTGESL